MTTDPLTASQVDRLHFELRTWASVCKYDPEDVPLLTRLRASHRSGCEPPGLLYQIAAADRRGQQKGNPPLDRDQTVELIEHVAQSVLELKVGC